MDANHCFGFGENRNILEGGELRHDSAGFMDGRREMVDQIFVFFHVQQACLNNIAVAHDAECAEYDE